MHHSLGLRAALRTSLQRAARKRKADELERQTNFRASQQKREAEKSRYDKLEPAKKKARIQQIIEQRMNQQAPPVFCTCGKKNQADGPLQSALVRVEERREQALGQTRVRRRTASADPTGVVERPAPERRPCVAPGSCQYALGEK